MKTKLGITKNTGDIRHDLTCGATYYVQVDIFYFRTFAMVLFIFDFDIVSGDYMSAELVSD